MANHIHRWLLSAVLSAPLATNASQPVSHDSRDFEERFVYDVRWSFIHLGTVTLTLTARGTTVVARTAARSRPSIPFVDLLLVHETTYDPSDLRISHENIWNGEHLLTTYRHDPERRQIVMVDSTDGLETRRDTVASPDLCFDANTLIHYTRRASAGVVTTTLPTAVGYAIRATDIASNGHRAWIDVPAFAHTVRGRYVTGTAHWVGSTFAGMQGSFEGWFSDDDAAVPLRASVKIVLGSIVLELTDYERPGWDPGALAPESTVILSRRGEAR